ncbi:hypothetical protein CesoFtcFv8_023711 [Champsocephalus esox]|uniref:Uncharacterized protein n=1 Tax=Champsocephalus esox TaxID=159716 RepID=A0AAN8B5G2_9TELE|nr:hypothetical protein CesoFtcFv8_023711 [Champsocephalus esox]
MNNPPNPPPSLADPFPPHPAIQHYPKTPPAPHALSSPGLIRHDRSLHYPHSYLPPPHPIAWRSHSTPDFNDETGSPRPSPSATPLTLTAFRPRTAHHSIPPLHHPNPPTVITPPTTSPRPRSAAPPLDPRYLPIGPPSTYTKSFPDRLHRHPRPPHPPPTPS